jgi:hypothetical protein
LESRSSLLLLLEDVDNPRLLAPDIRTRLLPTNDKVHVIATTTLDPQQFPGLSHLLINGLQENDSLRLLEKYRPFISDVEKEAARRVVHRLDGYVLALEIVSVYLWQNPDVSYNGFLERLEHDDLEAIEGASLEGSQLSRYNQNRISQLLLSTLNSLSSTERLAIAFASLLPPHSIPLSWIRSLVGIYEPQVLQQPPAGHPDQWLQIERRLLGLQLIHISSDKHLVQMSRLVGKFVNASYDPSHLDMLYRNLIELAIIRGKTNTFTFDNIQRELNWWEIDTIRQLAIPLLDKNQAYDYLLAHVAATILPWDLKKNEYLQRRVLTALNNKRIANKQDRDLILAESSFNLSQTVMLQYRYDEASDVLQHAIIHLQNSPNSEKLLIDKLLLQLEIVNQDEISHSIAIKKMRQEYQDELERLGPNHPEVIQTTDWFKVNDPEWLAEFVRLQEQRQEPIELVNLSETEECDKYLHRPFFHQDENIKTLPFSEEKTRDILGKLAVHMWRPVGQETISLDRKKIEEILGFESELEKFLDFCLKMNFLICTADGRFQFKDSTLRDYCAVPAIIKSLDRAYMDIPGMFQRTMNTLVQIGSVAVPGLLNAFRHEQYEVNSGAAIILREIGAPAIPSLSRALHHPYPNVRRWATQALYSYKNANAALTELISALHDKEFLVRLGSILTLGESRNPNAISSLCELLDDANLSAYVIDAQ